MGKLICAHGSEGRKQIWIGVTPEPGTITDPSLGMRAGKRKLNVLSSHAEAMRNLPFDRYKDESTTLSTGRPHRFYHFRDLCRHQILCLLSQGSFRACRLATGTVLQQSCSEHGPLFFDVWVTETCTTFHI